MNNTLVGNWASDNLKYGFSLIFSSHNNTLVGNTASNNYELGINLSYSNNLTLSRNTVSYNWYGIQLQSSLNSTIILNMFVENDNNALCLDSSDNVWDNETHGNYWSDYPEDYPMATNNFTTWNMPYIVGENNVDNAI